MSFDQEFVFSIMRPQKHCIGLIKLLQTPLFSDVTVLVAKEVELRLHKCVLCSQSDWFLKALTSGMEEAQKSEVKLDSEDPDVAAAGILWMYQGTYSLRDVHETFPAVGTYSKAHRDSPWTEATFHTRVWIFADYFQISELKDFAGTALQGALADVHNLAAACRLAYDETVEGAPIRKTLIEAVVRGDAFLSPSRWKQGSTSVDCPIVQLMNDNSEFGRDFLKNLVENQLAATSAHHCSSKKCPGVKYRKSGGRGLCGRCTEDVFQGEASFGSFA